MCQHCNWLMKLFGCKCNCEQKDKAASVPENPAAAQPTTEPAPAQPQSQEKDQQ
ncbi:MAG: hypothetical protein WC453_01185 [Patescibacteria group bacterium]